MSHLLVSVIQQFDGSMAMFSPLLSYPSHVFRGTNSCRITHNSRTRNLSALAIPPQPSSSTVVCSEESGLSQEFENICKASDGSTVSGSLALLSHANTVGIIGGMSAGFSLRFLKKLVTFSSSSNGEPTVPFVLCSDPALHREILSRDQIVVPCSDKTDTSGRLDQTWTVVVDNLVQKRTFLENSGIGCIVMLCHISHLWYDEVAKGCSVPVFHMAECVAKELKEAKLKPVEDGCPVRIGVLGTSATLSTGIYQEKLQKQGFEVVLPDQATIEHTINPAAQAMQREDIQGAKTFLCSALQVFPVRAVSTIILASDDLPDVLPEDDPLLKKCIDPMDALVKSTIRWAESVAEC